MCVTWAGASLLTAKRWLGLFVSFRHTLKGPFKNGLKISRAGLAQMILVPVQRLPFHLDDALSLRTHHRDRIDDREVVAPFGNRRDDVIDGLVALGVRLPRRPGFVAAAAEQLVSC